MSIKNRPYDISLLRICPIVTTYFSVSMQMKHRLNGSLGTRTLVKPCEGFPLMRRCLLPTEIKIQGMTVWPWLFSNRQGCTYHLIPRIVAFLYLYTFAVPRAHIHTRWSVATLYAGLSVRRFLALRNRTVPLLSQIEPRYSLKRGTKNETKQSLPMFIGKLG